MLKRLNDALPELILGIVIYGLLIEVVGVWFVEDKIRYSSGLLIGIVLACGMAINMAIVLEDAVSTMGQNHAQAKIIAKSVLRYVVVVIVFVGMMYFNLGNLFTAFFGVMGLKVAAYLQPLTHKTISRLRGETECEDIQSDMQGK